MEFKLQLIWLKRDLRIFDHAALANATGETIILYIIEPELWRQADLSSRHYLFLLDCLQDLDHSLRSYNLFLTIRVGDVLDVLVSLKKKYPIKKIISHQETWNNWTYQRDLAVASWCQQNKIAWHEFPNFGVVRGLKNRDMWSKEWNKHMYSRYWPMPEFISVKLDSDPYPAFSDLGLIDDACTFRQKGGRAQAKKDLEFFLKHSSRNYSKNMSSPVTAFEHCSRISTHLAFGAISMREVVQKTNQRLNEIDPKDYIWRRSLRAFIGRLHWHCHFIQKLETEPAIEFNNMHKAYDGLRNETNLDYLNAWKSGRTGYPMVDACMRCLISTGWLNFRMRAMLISFASHHLGLPWQKTGTYLATLFTDYEPGIHWSQVQMQSGTTGINSIRIYNPIKQSIDQDPKGVFLRKWLPELISMPDEYLHTPWVYPVALNGYPKPIVDEKIARKQASACLYGMRKDIEHKKESKKVYLKHGSRKKNIIKVQRELPL